VPALSVSSKGQRSGPRSHATHTRSHTKQLKRTNQNLVLRSVVINDKSLIVLELGAQSKQKNDF